MLRRIRVLGIMVALAGCSSSSSTGDGGSADLSSSNADLAGVDGSFAISDGGVPEGWLYTKGNKVYQSGTAAAWVGRGVNLDDLFMCGYNYQLGNNTAEAKYQAMLTGLFKDWKPTFLRVSLGMASFPTQPSWTDNEAQYKTPMVNLIHTMTGHAGVFVLVTVRSHASMILQDTIHGDAEATGIPSDSTTSPDKAKYPTGTDAMYISLVDTFANDSNVLFGITNEPGGNQRTDAVIAAAMNHAVAVIRAEEDRLGVPHHIVSVQGNGWTSSIGYYVAVAHRVPHDNVVYEVHGYPPTTASYTYADLPVIIGEYGTLDSTTQAAFFADLESKQIPNLAWDFAPYSNCAPDLIDTTTPADLTPTDWGKIVKAYLNAH